MALQVDKTYLTETLRDLVQINSVNPAFSDGVTNETVVAQRVAAELEHLGTQLTTIEAAAGRPSVVGRLSGRGGGPSLLLYGHLDTVGVEEMPNPFGAVVRDGRMYGQGTYDMKGGVAACLGSLKAIRDAGLTLAGDLFVTGVADEEVASAGMTAVLDQVRPDAAVSPRRPICVSAAPIRGSAGWRWKRTAAPRMAAGSRRGSGQPQDGSRAGPA